MQTEGCYYVILFVYILLWCCQCTAGHLTHSLIILTDSYINIYKILDISLGIIHLRTQKRVRKLALAAGEDSRYPHAGPTLDESLSTKLFNHVCTYQFKRLPVLGSFVNGLFLGALLMSAAIEGIQTCIHASHSEKEDEKSILLDHPVTYPAILVGFAAVGIMMQWCSNKAHEMREEELESESLWDLTANNNSSSDKSDQRQQQQQPVAELDASQLDSNHCKLNATNATYSSLPAIDRCHSKRNLCSNGSESVGAKSKKSVLNSSSKRHNSFESIPLDSGEPLKSSQMISLTSLKMAKDLESPNFVSISKLKAFDLESKTFTSNSSANRGAPIDGWLLIRYSISPFSLIVCALVVYFINKELVTEITDAALAIMVVILLFSASYPPMKKAGKILLQSVPEQVDLDRLKDSLKSVNPLITDILELHVWSLTPRSNRIATCKVEVFKDSIKSNYLLAQLIDDVKAKFASYNIKCTTIQPILKTSDLSPSSSTSCSANAMEPTAQSNHCCA